MFVQILAQFRTSREPSLGENTILATKFHNFTTNTTIQHLTGYQMCSYARLPEHKCILQNNI